MHRVVRVDMDSKRPYFCPKCQSHNLMSFHEACVSESEELYVFGWKCIMCGWHSGRKELGQVTDSRHVEVPYTD
jgi:RNase P subunit RPR2